MAYLAVNKDGKEMIFNNEPDRTPEDLAQVYDNVKHRHVYKHEPIIWNEFEILNMYDYVYYGIPLPAGTIEKIIGRKLNWNDNPVQI